MSPPEINVDQLMHQIRQSVAQRAAANGEMPDQNAAGPELVVGQIDSAGLALQPDFQASPTNTYHASDLLKYHGEPFVRNAYRAILKREPDAAGLADHFAKLAGGRFNKVDVLASLHYSPEGRSAGVSISGLAWPATIRRIERIPVIGYWLQVAIGLARLPILLKHQRQQEFYVISRQEQIVDYTNRQLTETANEYSARASTIEDEINLQKQTTESLQREIASGLKGELATIRTALNDLEQRSINLNEELNEKATSLAERADNLEAETKNAHQRLLTDLGLQERRLTDLFEQAEIQEGANEAGLDELYATFEDQFRGERTEIRNRLRVYLPILEGASIKQDVVDLGCGRGEWLELLRDSGIKARGVDHNRVFIDRCKRLDLDVIEADAIAYLRGLPEQSVNVVTSFHLVEHLPFKTLLKLLDEMVRVLRRDSPLILETPNPENFTVGSHTFYADPTHRNPIPSATLRFLLESHGLGRIEVMKIRARDEVKLPGDDELTKRFNQYFYSSPDYGIVGWKI